MGFALRQVDSVFPLRGDGVDRIGDLQTTTAAVPRCGPRASPVWFLRVRGTQLMMVIIAAVAFFSAPLSGQHSAGGSALVVIPRVSELEITPASAVQTRSLEDGVVEEEGALLVRVRANHEWRVQVGTSSAGDSASGVWWRATLVSEGITGEYRALSPGEEAVVASGARGEVLIRVDYRWKAPEDATAGGVPLTYTLASL